MYNVSYLNWPHWPDTNRDHLASTVPGNQYNYDIIYNDTHHIVLYHRVLNKVQDIPYNL